MRSRLDRVQLTQRLGQGLYLVWCWRYL